MNEKIIKQLLKGAGFPDSILAESEKDDFDLKTALENLHAKQKLDYTDIIRNDIEPEIEERVSKEKDGYWIRVIAGDFKKRGVPGEELKIDKDTYKKPHEMMDVYAKHIEQKFKVAEQPEVIKSLQEENLSLKNQLTEKETEFNAKFEAVKKEEQGKTISRFVDLGLQKNFNTLPEKFLLGGKRNEGMFRATSSLLKDKYDLSIDDKEEIVIFEKGTQKRVTGKNSEGKEYFVPVKDLVEGTLKDLGFWVESNGGTQSGQRATTEAGDKSKFKSARALELEKLAAQA